MAQAPQLVPVILIPDQPVAAPAAAEPTLIEIDLPRGYQVLINGNINSNALRAVLDVFERRRSRSLRACAVGRTEMRRGMTGLALQVQQAMDQDPDAGDLSVSRGARRDLIKILWHDGVGMSLYAKRPERSRFTTPSQSPTDGAVAISAAQFGYMLGATDRRNPKPAHHIHRHHNKPQDLPKPPRELA